jgi:pimeloyl-ACP methyl ester carboxylesterase
MEPVLHDLGGEGSPLLICHATGFHGRCYASLAASLTQSHHVVAVDLRGHGSRPIRDGESLHFADIADDVAAAARTFAEPPHLFGHSLGAVVAMLAEIGAGGLVRSMFLYEPGLHAADTPMTGNLVVAEGARRRRNVFASRGEAMLRYASRMPLSEMSAESLAAYVTHGFEDLPDGQVQLCCERTTEATIFEYAGETTMEDVVGVSVPTVLASGGQQRSSLAEANERLAKLLPDGTYRCFPHLGHLGPLEHPPTVAAAVLEHTAMVDGAG